MSSKRKAGLPFAAAHWLGIIWLVVSFQSINGFADIFHDPCEFRVFNLTASKNLLSFPVKNGFPVGAVSGFTPSSPQLQRNLNRQITPVLFGLLVDSQPRNKYSRDDSDQTSYDDSSQFSAHKVLISVVVGSVLVWVGIAIGVYWSRTILLPNDRTERQPPGKAAADTTKP